MLFQIHVPRRHQKCQEAGEKIEAGMEYHSVLFEEGEDAYRRLDYCIPCWEKMEKDELVKEACTHWKSRVPDKVGVDERTRNRNEKALELLKEAVESGNHEKAVILAMFLQRKKILLFRQELVREDGDTYLLYEVNGTEEMLPIRKVSITGINAAAMQEEIVKAFNE
jgi:hypothetical protein